MHKIIIAIVLFSSILFSKDVKVGSYLPCESCKNQFDQTIIVDKKTKMLIVCFTQEQDEIVNQFLQDNKNFLKKYKAYYIRDLSSVPTFVVSMFIKPNYKSLDYDVGLILDESKALKLPKQDNKITIIYLRKKKVRKILFKDNLDFLIKKRK
jgi:hypothetical protein